jgi:flagellar biosynthesis protein FlhF
MNVKKYTAPTMEAALEQVKSELGRDAVILHTRCFRRGGVFGLGGNQLVEITASNQVSVSPRSLAASRPVERAYRSGASGASAGFLALKNDVAGLRSMLEDVLKHTRPARTSFWPESLQRWHKHLTDRGTSDACSVEVLEPLAARFAGSRAADQPAVEAAVLARIAEFVRTAPPIAAGVPGDPAIVAFVGPTGVGKTTTIAKLAAHFALRERKPVGLITLDTYRIAAVEQLRTYARIIDVPLEVVLSPAEMPDAVERLSGCALILIDTAGRSQRDALKINDLKAFFERKRPGQIHLVLSATAERLALADTIEKFSVYRPDRVLLTKIDELPAAGKLLDAIPIARQPVSYVTTGQDVPDDIETARPQYLAALIAGGDSIDR